ncbi:MAG: hypothetical protein AAF320_04000 [Myxococcota bacterium]
MATQFSQKNKNSKEQERAELLKLTLDNIEKQFGKGSVMRLGEAKALWNDVETFSSGSIGLDMALG